jgi:hypothetical protein
VKQTISFYLAPPSYREAVRIGNSMQFSTNSRPHNPMYPMYSFGERPHAIQMTISKPHLAINT